MPVARPPIFTGSWQARCHQSTHCTQQGVMAGQRGLASAQLTHPPNLGREWDSPAWGGREGARNPLPAAPSALRYQLGLRVLGSSGLGALQGRRSRLPQVMGRGLSWS